MLSIGSVPNKSQEEYYKQEIIKCDAKIQKVQNDIIKLEGAYKNSTKSNLLKKSMSIQEHNLNSTLANNKHHVKHISPIKNRQYFDSTFEENGIDSILL